MSIELKVFFISIVSALLFYVLFFDHLSNNHFNQFLFFLIPLIWPGIAHGSLDLLIAKKKKLINDVKSTLLFIILYVFLASSIVLVWFFQPNVAILLFLMISIVHFGTSDTKTAQKKIIYLPEVIIRGLIPICVPIYYFSTQINLIFSKLFITDSFYTNLVKLNEIIFFMLIFLIIFLLIFLLMFKRNKEAKMTSLEIITIFLCFVYFEPLISFCLYFCFMHSIRHLIDEKKNLGLSNKQLVLQTLPITSVTIFAMIFCYFFISFDDDYFKFLPILFISLASLTVPHMLMVSWSKSTYKKN